MPKALHPRSGLGLVCDGISFFSKFFFFFFFSILQLGYLKRVFISVNAISPCGLYMRTGHGPACFYSWVMVVHTVGFAVESDLVIAINWLVGGSHDEEISFEITDSPRELLLSGCPAYQTERIAHSGQLQLNQHSMQCKEEAGNAFIRSHLRFPQ